MDLSKLNEAVRWNKAYKIESDHDVLTCEIHLKAQASMSRQIQVELSPAQKREEEMRLKRSSLLELVEHMEDLLPQRTPEPTAVPRGVNMLVEAVKSVVNTDFGDMEAMSKVITTLEIAFKAYGEATNHEPSPSTPGLTDYVLMAQVPRPHRGRLSSVVAELIEQMISRADCDGIPQDGREIHIPRGIMTDIQNEGMSLFSSPPTTPREIYGVTIIVNYDEPHSNTLRLRRPGMDASEYWRPIGGNRYGTPEGRMAIGTRRGQ